MWHCPHCYGCALACLCPSLAGGLYLRTSRRLLERGLWGYKQQEMTFQLVCWSSFPGSGSTVFVTFWENDLSVLKCREPLYYLMSPPGWEMCSYSTSTRFVPAPGCDEVNINIRGALIEWSMQPLNIMSEHHATWKNARAFVINENHWWFSSNMNILFSTTFHPMVLASTNDPYLTQLLHWELLPHF